MWGTKLTQVLMGQRSHHSLIPSSPPSKMHISNWLSQADTNTSKVMPISDELRQVATNTSNLPCLSFEWHKVEAITHYHNVLSLPLDNARLVVKARQKCTKRNPLRADHMTNRHLRHTQEHVPHSQTNTAMKLTCEKQSLLLEPPSFLVWPKCPISTATR